MSYLRLKCTKFDFGWGSAPDPAGGAHSPPRPPSWILGASLFWVRQGLQSLNPALETDKLYKADAAMKYHLSNDVLIFCTGLHVTWRRTFHNSLFPSGMPKTRIGAQPTLPGQLRELDGLFGLFKLCDNKCKIMVIPPTFHLLPIRYDILEKRHSKRQ